MQAYKDENYSEKVDPEVLKQLETLKAAVVEAIAKLTAFATEKGLTVSTEFDGLVSNYGETLPFTLEPKKAKPEGETDWDESYGGDSYEDARGSWRTSTGG